jgi:hypothetical protein
MDISVTRHQAELTRQVCYRNGAVLPQAWQRDCLLIYELNGESLERDIFGLHFRQWKLSTVCSFRTGQKIIILDSFGLFSFPAAQALPLSVNQFH